MVLQTDSTAVGLSSNASGPRLDIVAPLDFTATDETGGLSEIGVGCNEWSRFVVSSFCEQTTGMTRCISVNVPILVQLCVDMLVDTDVVYSLLVAYFWTMAVPSEGQ